MMNRREVLKAMSALALCGCASVPNRFSKKKAYRFDVWDKTRTLVPVTRVTPDDASYVHTYFDVTPFSPSQRYFAATRVPPATRLPVLGDLAHVCMIDLYEQECKGEES